MTNPSNNPNRRLRKTAQNNIRRVGMIGAQNLFGDPNTETFAKQSARMEASRRRTASLGGGLAGNGDAVQMAMGRPRDPMFYWRQNNIPFDFTKPEELRKIREFCNTDDAPILLPDGTYKPLGQIQPGDQVIGWKNQLTQTGSLIRHWQPTTVLAVKSRVTEVVLVTLASGKTIKCTPDHKWANPFFTKNLDYTTSHSQEIMQTLTQEYRPAMVGAELLAINGTYVVDVAPGGTYAQATTEIPSNMDKVISIQPIGEATVVSMQTVTGNYVAWGFASKNCRLLYMTHPVIAACVDIYSKLPLQGMNLQCKDPQLVDFYQDLFFDQLKLEDHLVRLGRQYWLSGEIFSLGMWNENLGVWEEEQLISPDNVEVESSLFINKPRFLMRLPEQVRKVLTERSPVWEYKELIEEYPELMQFAKEDELMPVSNYIMFQMRFEGDDFSNRGISILMRAFRTIIQEEMLMTALDSIADRLYTPMIVAKLGASATDLGTDVPWIPTDDQKLEFNQSLDAALAGDFRVLTTNFATNIETVFGRENVPDLSNDFDRITERILMAFGLSQTMLTGASAGETYAADALNRDVVTQLLTHYQRKLQDYFRARAEIVAEAQEHFDYEVRNGERFLITEDIWEIDEETGEEVLYEQPKLLVPELKFKILNLTDESEMSEFIETLAMEGQIPIPIRDRIRRTGIDFDEMLEVKTQETIQLAVAEQRARKELYSTLVAEGLPIPDDLIKDFRPQAIQAQPAGASDVAVPQLGQGPQDLPVLAPTEDDLDDDQMAEGEQMGDDVVNAQTEPQDPQEDLQQPGDDVPPESTEQMGRMPKPAVLKTKAVRKLGIKDVTKKRYVAPDNSQETKISDWQPIGRFGIPKVVGMRRYLHIPDDLKLKQEPDSD